MNIICRRIWDKDLNVAKWAKLNNFSPAYTHLVIREERGVSYSGKAKKIMLALADQGFLTEEELESRILRSRDNVK